jgi:nucleotide-binding universal stress UspA family protein
MATTPHNILALYESTGGGEGAVRHAVSIAGDHDARLTVVTVAVAEPTDRKCCDLRSVYWNKVLRQIADEELAAARTAVGADARADFRVLSGRSVAIAVAREASRCGIDLVVVPRERGLLPWSRTRRFRQVRRRVRGSAVVVGPA